MKNKIIRAMIDVACIGSATLLGYFLANRRNKKRNESMCRAYLVFDYADSECGPDMYIKLTDDLETIMSQDYVYCKIVKGASNNANEKENCGNKA